MVKNILTILLFVLTSGSLIGQDEHFSQFYALPIHMNPALAGAYNGTYRMTAIYRDQWNNALESPYKTFAIGGDTKIKLDFTEQLKDDHFGVGLFFVSDRVATFQTNTNKISGYFAYHKSLGANKRSFLGAGMKFGIIQRNINYDNLTFQDQFNQVNDFSLPTSENLPPNNIGVVDVSLGVNYYFTLGDATQYFLGFAAHHLTNPNISFFNRQQNPNPSTDLTQTLPSKYVAHFGVDHELQYRLSIQPRVIYQKQGVNTKVDVGTNVQYTFKNLSSAFIFGMWGSFINDLDGMQLDHVTPLVGIQQGAFIFGLSYDIALRDAFDSSFGFNTFEFSIRFTGEHENDNTFCPTF